MEQGWGSLVTGDGTGADNISLSSSAPSTLADVFSSEYRSLVVLAVALVSNPATAEELVMDAFLRTFTGWHRLRDTSAAPVYLRRCVVNLAKSTYRRRRVESNAYERLENLRRNDGLADPAALAAGSLPSALALLAPGKRAVVVLRYWEDRSEAETAEIMGCSVGTVKSQLAKAVTQLREALTTDVRQEEQ